MFMAGGLRLHRKIPQGLLLGMLILTFAGMAPKPSVVPGKPLADLEVFVRKGCPHCEEAKLFLEDLQREQPALRILIRDLAEDPAALVRLETLAMQLDVKRVGIPAFLVRGQLIIGYAGPSTTGQHVKALLKRPPPDRKQELPEGTCELTSAAPCDHETDSLRTVPPDIDTPLFGRLNVRDLGLPLFTILLGLLDGFNPCAMWVLLFLLSLLANLRDRLKMCLMAGTFIAVSGGVYFAFMAAWINIFLIIGYSRSIQLLLGGMAGAIGAINVKDFFTFRQGLSLSIPETTKSAFYVRIRCILQAEHMGEALSGIVLLAILVNVIELACTAGFPAVYTQILALQSLGWWEYYGYLALYNLAYIADDSLMVTLAVITLSHRKLQEREGRWLKLISGLVMLGLGITLVVTPEWLA